MAQGCTVSEAKAKETQKVSINACLCHFDSLSAEMLPIKHNASQIPSCHTFQRADNLRICHSAGFSPGRKQHTAYTKVTLLLALIGTYFFLHHSVLIGMSWLNLMEYILHVLALPAY